MDRLITSVPGLFHAPERHTHISTAIVIDKHLARLQGPGRLQCLVDVRCPDSGSEAVDGIVSNLDRFLQGIETDNGQG